MDGVLPVDIVGNPITKNCQYCEVDKPLAAFDRHSHHKDGYDSRCKDCVKERRAFISKVKKFAPPKPQMCEIDGCARLAHVCDHDSDIKDPKRAFRGWICDEHNRSIGQIGDRIENVEAVLQYLQRAKKRGRSL